MVDADGYLALWVYKDKYFEEKVSFKPHSTVFLDLIGLHWQELPMDKEKDVTAKPTLEQLEKLEVGLID